MRIMGRKTRSPRQGPIITDSSLKDPDQKCRYDRRADQGGKDSITFRSPGVRAFSKIVLLSLGVAGLS